jgi:hypothetical protein
MDDPGQKQLYANVLSVLALLLIASGVLVRTLPLESKRPGDAERAGVSYAGRQDVPARLWEDPFAAMRGVKGRSPDERCQEAIGDRSHYPSALTGSLRYHSDPRRNRAITVLPVLVPGGPHFEDGEARRRTRYAVLLALFNAGWTPAEEDKLGYVWTFESCVDSPWQRRAPEVLPYEWLFHESGAEGSAAGGQPRAILILWIDDDAVARRPLQGIEAIVERLAVGGPPCAADAMPSDRGVREQRREVLNERFRKAVGCVDLDLAESPIARGCGWPGGVIPKDAWLTVAGRQKSLPWCDTRVIGPWTSGTLLALVGDLVPELDSRPSSPPSWLRFYSASAADSHFQAALDRARRASSDPVTPTRVGALRERFDARVVRLTTTDDKLVRAFADELERRLADPTPFWRIGPFRRDGSALCGDTIVLVSEGDSSYARLFRDLFRDDFEKRAGNAWGTCGAGREPRVRSFGYLRGLDGVLPEEGTGGRVSTPAPPSAQWPTARDVLLDRAALERADGRSQYDYLRRLAGQLEVLDVQERREGRKGVRAIGVLGNDAYDKILVLEALRDRFRKAVFFAADLDARLMGASAVASTRNLVVASSYGLTVNPGLQGSAPAFRDTYQSGSYLAARIAVDPAIRSRSSADFAGWFEAAQLFEIGRTRAIALSADRCGADRVACAATRCDEPDPARCPSVHDFDEWSRFDWWPGRAAVGALATMLLAAGGLAWLIWPAGRDWPRSLVSTAALGIGALALFAGAAWVIQMDASSGAGEPFTWFEGVSIWPTQILRVAVLIIIAASLIYGRRQLVFNIDRVAGAYHLPTLTDRQGGREVPVGGAGVSPDDPWEELLDRLRFSASATRIAGATLLFFVFGMALLSLDWPNSPHRGWVSAWSDHVLQLVLLAGMMALLFAALDCEVAATRLLTRLDPSIGAATWRESPDPDLLARYPVSERAFRLWTRFRFAVMVASGVNRFIYLPFLALLLVLPTRSRLFDAWDLPVPYAVLLLVFLALAWLCAFRLRRAAADLRARILDELERETERDELAARARPAPSDLRDTPGAETIDHEASGVTPAVRVELLKRVVEQIRTARDGPFRPLAQEPVVRAILVVFGASGGIATAEFLFLSRM